MEPVLMLINEFGVAIVFVMVIGVLIAGMFAWLQSLKKMEDRYLIDMEKVQFTVEANALREMELLDVVAGKSDVCDKDVAISLLMSKYDYSALELTLVQQGWKRVE